jgi:two-component system response regulator FlrC
MKILIVDDSVPMLELLEMILVCEGHEIHAIHDSNKALDVVQVETFDLIVSDINMPAPNGIDFGNMVRKFNSSIPIFYFSAEVDGSSRYASVINKIGNATYIDKDVALLLYSIKNAGTRTIG